MLTYRFFWGGIEYQLMSFTGSLDDPDEEDLIGVYTSNSTVSLKNAIRDIIDDAATRGIRQYTVEVDTYTC